MLLLTRNATQSFFIGKDIKVTICAVHGNQVKVGIDAPKEVQILREEIMDKYTNNPHTKEAAGNK